MDDIQPMNILYPADQLMKHFARLLLTDSFILDYIVEQLAVLDVLHHEEQLLGCFDNLVELDDIGMPNELQNVYLSRHALHICNVHYLILFQDLYGYDLARRLVCRQFDLTKGPFP